MRLQAPTFLSVSGSADTEVSIGKGFCQEWYVIQESEVHLGKQPGWATPGRLLCSHFSHCNHEEAEEVSQAGEQREVHIALPSNRPVLLCHIDPGHDVIQVTFHHVLLNSCHVLDSEPLECESWDVSLRAFRWDMINFSTEAKEHASPRAHSV